MSARVRLRRVASAVTFLLVSATSLTAQEVLLQEADQDESGTSPLRDTASFLRELIEADRQTTDGFRAKPVSGAALSISTIRSDEFEQLGVRYLSDALRSIPGMEVVRLTSTDSNVSARGYNDASSSSQGMLALVDGRLQYNEFYGNVVWDGLIVSLDEIERIEVVRGPGSFLYGPNALHGLVNVFTRGPLDYERDSVNLVTRLGTYESAVSSLTHVHRPSPETGLKTTIVWDDIDSFDEANDANTRDKLFGELRFAHDFGSGEVLELTGGVSEQRIDLVLPELSSLPVSALLTNDVEERFVKANYANEGLQAQLFWTGFDSTSDADVVYQDFTVGLDTVQLDLLTTYELWPDHATTIGSGGRFATFDTANADVSEGRHDTTLVWGYFQDVFMAADDVTVTAGLRVDFHSVAGTNVSPRLATVWEFEEQQFLRASAGSGFRNPSLRELWFNMPLQGPGAGVTILGNDDLEAESVRSFELGYASDIGGLGEDFRGSATLFYNLLDDRIVFELDPALAVIAPENANDEESYGFEAEAEYLFGDTLSGSANYSYTEQKNRDTNEINRMNPRHKANLGLRYWAPGDVTAMLRVGYFDETEFEGRQADDYFLVNGSLSKPFRWGESQGRAFIEAFNLLDDDHREHPDGQSYGLILQAGISLTF